MTQTLADNESFTRHRHRLLEGMAHAVAEKGYAETTIADIVRAAAVSRRTFYEHFATKSACLIALYEAASHGALKVLRDALGPDRDWQDQVEQAMVAYFECLARNPALVRTLFIEILGLGAEGLAARRRVNDEIVDFMLLVINRSRGRRPLPREMAMAIVGGVNELVLNAIETGQVERLRELAIPAVQLIRAVTQDRA
ncbi:TetR/AcrR family transcriptional regulator [Noviherbaspirillum sp. ST9]|uniref:TetR/AcrR family transcriptional regulator n=1 Tax=Noviherbaspirillum sp. ST9 TaxID=3401606 RepID=UPI003B589B9A